MARIDGERREGGQKRATEILVEVLALRLARLLRPQHHDAVGGEERPELVQEVAMVLADELAEACAQLIPARAVVAALAVRSATGSELHAMDGEELVDVGAQDGEELHALAQRYPWIPHLREHPAVGLEPGELPDAIGHHAIRGKGSSVEASSTSSLRQDVMSCNIFVIFSYRY